MHEILVRYCWVRTQPDYVDNLFSASRNGQLHYMPSSMRRLFAVHSQRSQLVKLTSRYFNISMIC